MITYKSFIVYSLMCLAGCSASMETSIRKNYYDNGILKSVKSYKNGALNGISREYFEDGTLEHAINYKNNQVDGLYHTYYPSGALWKNETYENDALVNRKEYNEEGEVIKEEYFYRK